MRKSAKGLYQKVWTQTVLSYLVPISRFVLIYAFYKALVQLNIQEYQKQWSHLFANTLFVANLEIHAKTTFSLSLISNNAPDARIEGTFAFSESLPTTAILPCINFDKSIHTTIQQFEQNSERGVTECRSE